jgi:hypothetical protein
MDTQLKILIPDDVDFADLKLTRDPVTHDVEFDWRPIERICDANNVDPSLFKKGIRIL